MVTCKPRGCAAAGHCHAACLVALAPAQCPPWLLHCPLLFVAAEAAEHDLVIKQLEPMESTRRCYRMIGDVLVERTVGEALPAGAPACSHPPCPLSTKLTALMCPHVCVCVYSWCPIGVADGAQCVGGREGHGLAPQHTTQNTHNTAPILCTHSTVRRNREGLGQVMKQLQAQLEVQQKALAEHQTRYKIRVGAGAGGDEEPSGNRKPGGGKDGGSSSSGAGVLI